MVVPSAEPALSLSFSLSLSLFPSSREACSQRLANVIVRERRSFPGSPSYFIQPVYNARKNVPRWSILWRYLRSASNWWAVRCRSVYPRASSLLRCDATGGGRPRNFVSNELRPRQPFLSNCTGQPRSFLVSSRSVERWQTRPWVVVVVSGNTESERKRHIGMWIFARRIVDSIYHLNRKYKLAGEKNHAVQVKNGGARIQFIKSQSRDLYLAVAMRLILLLTRQRFHWWRWLILPFERASFAVVIAYASTARMLFTTGARTRSVFTRTPCRFHSRVTRMSLIPNFNVPLIIDYYAFWPVIDGYAEARGLFDRVAAVE